MLKILVHAESRELLGVHVFGTNATELVHIGQTVMGCGGTVDYPTLAVFNYPTLAESDKVAALDAVNKTLARAGAIGAGRNQQAAITHREIGADGRAYRFCPPGRPPAAEPGRAATRSSFGTGGSEEIRR